MVSGARGVAGGGHTSGVVELQLGLGLLLEAGQALLLSGRVTGGQTGVRTLLNACPVAAAGRRPAFR